MSKSNALVLVHTQVAGLAPLRAVEDTTVADRHARARADLEVSLACRRTRS